MVTDDTIVLIYPSFVQTVHDGQPLCFYSFRDVINTVIRSTTIVLNFNSVQKSCHEIYITLFDHVVGSQIEHVHFVISVPETTENTVHISLLARHSNDSTFSNISYNVITPNAYVVEKVQEVSEYRGRDNVTHTSVNETVYYIAAN